MAGWTIIVWLLLSFFLVPMSTAVLGWGILRGEQLVVGNDDIIGWLFTPGGILYLLLAGGLTITAAIIRFAGLFRIITDDMVGKPVSLASTLQRTLPYVPKLFKLCVAIVVWTGFVLMPLILGAGILYLILLGDHDINYYLTIQPSEWYHFLIAGSVWSLLWLTGALYMFSKTLLSLPAYLSAERTIRQALKRSWNLARDRTARLIRLLVFSIGIWIITRLLVDVLLLFTASIVVGWISSTTDSLRLIALFTGGYVATALFTSAVIGFLGFSFVSTVVTKFYYEDSELYRKSQPPPGFRELQARFAGKVNRMMKPAKIIPLLLLFIAGSSVSSAFMISRISVPGDIIISAHRAGPPPAPENTLSALESAIEAGADYTEIDVQRTADGIVVVVHDADYMRVAGDPRRVDQTDYEAIKGFVQVPDDGSPPEKRQIATLDDFLERADGRISLMIELKYYGFDPLLVGTVIERIRAYQMEDQVVLMSLNLESLNQIRQQDSGIPVGYVSALAIGDLSRLPVDFLAINQQAANPGLVRNAHQNAIEIYPWTVNRVKDMVKMVDLGIDGLITDDPALARQVVNELNELSNIERLLLRFGTLLIEDDNPEDTAGTDEE